MSEPQALRILVITSRPLVTVETERRNGQLVFVRHPIPLKPVWHVRQELERALKDAGGSVTVRYLACTTTVAVQTALLDSYDVVHFVGHGTEDGRLLLEQENAVADLLSVERAAQMLRGSHARLVVISACHSGKAAQALRKAGITNVVAVDEQFPIEDRAAASSINFFTARWCVGGRSQRLSGKASMRCERTTRWATIGLRWMSRPVLSYCRGHRASVHSLARTVRSSLAQDPASTRSLTPGQCRRTCPTTQIL